MAARWLLSGLFFFSLIPVLFFYEQTSFNQKEPYYERPLAVASNILLLRKDSYGQGYFGASRNNGRIHEGIDIVTPVGSSVIASKSGRVSFAGDDVGYGHYVEILHPDGLVTRYAHLSRVQVKEGEWVAQNQVIGASGKTGNANRLKITPHLHFEIRYKNQPLNPSSHLLDPNIHLET